MSGLWPGDLCQRAYRAHDLCELFQLAHGQGLQELNATQRFDEGLSASFAGCHHCCECVGVQLKQDACNVAQQLGHSEHVQPLRGTTYEDMTCATATVSAMLGVEVLALGPNHDCKNGA